jgi:hypothetical protein
MPATRFIRIREGLWRATPDDAFRRRVLALVQSKYGTKGRAAEHVARTKILEHPYLDSDRWQQAEELRHKQRVREGRARVDILEGRLNRGEIHYLGIEGMSGEPKLTADRLRNRKLRTLDVSKDLLVIEAPRHPRPDTTLWQSWLYSEPTASLSLLDVRDVAEVVPERVVVGSDSGGWRDPASHLEDDFFDTVRQVLGLSGLASVKKMIDRDEDELATLTGKVVSGVRDAYGIDCREMQGTRRAAFEAECLKRFGPRARPADITIHTRKMRLVYEYTPHALMASSAPSTEA